MQNNQLSSKVKISVQDFGIGILPEDQEKLFKPFQRVQTEQSAQLNPNGNGLGLYICRSIARCMGGDITMKSVVGVGTTMTLVLNLERVKVNLKQLVQRDLSPMQQRSTILQFNFSDQVA